MDKLKSALEAMFTPSPAVFAIGVAVIILFPVLLHYILGRATGYTSLPSVLLVGPSGAGKTALLTLFERGPLPQTTKSPSTPAAAPTHTSQTPSAVELAVSEDRTSSFRDDLDATGSAAKKFLLLDTPGHGKLRQHALSRLSSSSSDLSKSGSSPAPGKPPRAVVFVVDAADADGLTGAAEYLYEVLLSLQRRAAAARTSRGPGSVPVLVAANKLDLFTALPAALVRSGLESELGRLRSTRSRALPDSGVGADEVDGGGPEEADGWLGEYGSEKFSFGQMMEFGVEVDVIGGNVVGEGPGVDKWWKWIADRI
ncbi:putative srp receptor beta subunit protein [Phialemonium atrogriseum]|uniref:Signal recognition particle receptor subunit beta n=1 Tax=Phialemonium atrogriseum TaxID=1093897 RepID=A0AAJ0BS21_9PEZI|nr:putative srp receptor beta subunit protein [Phialemonium atrogriseum]KAK1763434.1 putative srp receptor beta subunit protein [Phialemonium atrogriseum]